MVQLCANHMVHMHFLCVRYVSVHHGCSYAFCEGVTFNLYEQILSLIKKSLFNMDVIFFVLCFL